MIRGTCLHKSTFYQHIDVANASQSNSYSRQSAMIKITVGVLALQGAFLEHIELLKKAAASLGSQQSSSQWEFLEVRTPQELKRCDALVLPGGESTAISLVAARSNLLEPLRDFVK